MVVRGRVGQAFIEAVAETDGFERALEGSLRRAVDHASRDRNWDPLVDAAERAAEEAGEEFAGGFSAAVSRGVSSLPDLLGKGVLTGLTALSQLLVPLLVTIPLVSIVVFGLGNALVSLIGIVGAIPSLAFGLIAALGPLLIVFQGIGDAVSALTSGDMDKFNESLKKLTPSAAGVLREFKSLMPVFSAIRKVVQESFFSRITGDFTRLFTIIKGPLLAGLANVSFALGNVVSQLLKFAGSTRFVTFLAALFGSVADGINRNGPALIRFFDALTVVAVASLPAVSEFLDRLADGLDRFSALMQQSVNDGSFQQFLDDAFTTMSQLKDLTFELLGLFIDMFTTTDEKGKTFLESVTEAIRKMREFFQSPEGKKFIDDMLEAANNLANVLGFIADNLELITLLFQPLITAVGALNKVIEELDKKDKSFLGNFLRILGTSPIPGLPRFAGGGITDQPSIAGEAGPEAILPLDDPVRARQIAADPRVADLIGGGETTVIAVFDGEPFQARIVNTVRGANARTARAVAQKPRR